MNEDTRLRRPTEDDYAAIANVVDEWWGERRTVDQLPRLWLRHFGETSWLAEDAARRLAGFLVGFMSPAEADTAVCHLIGVAPMHRHHGLGRRLYASFEADARAAGATRILALVWPGDPIAVRFHAALGFEPFVGPGTQRLYGTPALPNYDFGRVDRVMFERRL